MNTVVLYIASSLDGFITRENGAVDWLDPYQESDYEDFIKEIGPVIMGHTTYKQVLTFGDFPYKKMTAMSSHTTTI